MANRDSAIGVFDSGIGGLTVLHKIIEALPRENTVYLGDTARAPYGTKSVETVLRYSFENGEFLVEKDVQTPCRGMQHVNGYRSWRLARAFCGPGDRRHRARRKARRQKHEE